MGLGAQKAQLIYSTILMQNWIVYGSELSPFTLKVLAMCRYKGLPYRFFPDQGSNLENMKIQLRKERLLRGQLPLTSPLMSAEDEFPLVPFLFGPKGENLYDSTAIAHWLDESAPLEFMRSPLIPTESAALNFAVSLIDEYADEFGLYLAHHNRWKFSAKSNNAGQRLSKELPVLVAPFRKKIDEFFSERQVRRLPYLFSVAPQGYTIKGLAEDRQPPHIDGFPATHDLLEEAFENLLEALEPILTKRSYLFGERVTLADMSLYGQLGMNLSDPEARAWIARIAPNTLEWLERMHSGDFIRSRTDYEIVLHEDLAPLLTEICRTFVPLMQQNLAAYNRFLSQGEKQFNEAAFEQGRCLYDGKINGLAFRHVAKSFQAKIWRVLQQQWYALPDLDRAELLPLLPHKHKLDKQF